MMGTQLHLRQKDMPISVVDLVDRATLEQAGVDRRAVRKIPLEMVGIDFHASQAAGRG